MRVAFFDELVPDNEAQSKQPGIFIASALEAVACAKDAPNPISPMIIPERRRAERVRVNLDVIFADSQRQYKGTISDISVTGCFMLAAVEATPDELMTIIIQLPNNKTVKLTGEVVYNTDEIGFALRFVDLPDSTLRFIQKLVERFRQSPAQPGKAARQ